MWDSERQSAPSSPEPRFIDCDLYCLECGYNLRGLSGDPVRCPECGYDNPIVDAEIPAALITAQLQKMEPGGVVFTALCFVAPILLEVPFGSDLLCLLAPQGFALLAWLILALGKFPASCLRRPGWFSALLAYHFWALLLLIGFIGVPAAGLVFAGDLFRRLGVDRTDVHIAIVAVGLVVYIAALIKCLPWAYRRATRTMWPLQRDVALTIATREIQKRLARGRHKWGRPG